MSEVACEKVDSEVGYEKSCGVIDTHASVPIESYVGKHVIVNFNGKPYVGLVTESSLSSVHVDCMHRKGRIRNQ